MMKKWVLFIVCILLIILLNSTHRIQKIIASSAEGAQSKTSAKYRTDPHTSDSDEASARETRTIKRLIEEGRPCPVSDEEALKRALAGLARSQKYGRQSDPLEIETLEKAQEHLKSHIVLIAGTKFYYGMELPEWFAFSGIVLRDIANEESIEMSCQTAFEYGWAVRKSDGEIRQWQRIVPSPP